MWTMQINACKMLFYFVKISGTVGGFTLTPKGKTGETVQQFFFFFFKKKKKKPLWLLRAQKKSHLLKIVGFFSVRRETGACGGSV